MKKASFPLFLLSVCAAAGAVFSFSCATSYEKSVTEERPAEKTVEEAVEETAEEEKDAGPTPEEIRRLEEERTDRAVEEYIQNGETERALETFEQTYSPDTAEDPDVLLMYGLLLIAEGNFGKAGEVFKRAAELDPDNTKVLYNLSIIEGSQGNREKQQELLEKIIEETPGHVEAQTSLGDLYLEKKQWKAAKEAFQSAMKGDETFIPAKMGYAEVLRQEEAFAEAEEVLSRIIEMAPGYVLAYIDRSRNRVALQDRQGAVEDLSTAIDLDPDNFWNYLDRGRIRLRLGRLREALADFSRAVELDPDNFFPYAYRGGIYDQLEEYDKALADFERVAELREDYYFAYSSLGKLYYMKEKWIDAALAFGKAFTYEDDMQPYAMFSAACMYRGGMEEEGKAYLQEVMPSIPRESIYYHLMRLYLDDKYETYFLTKIEAMQDRQLKGEALFFLALFYDLRGRQRLSATYFLEVTDLTGPESITHQLALWEFEH